MIKAIQHPQDPTVTLLVDTDHGPHGLPVIPAAQSMVGIDVDGNGLIAYRKGDKAYSVAVLSDVNLIRTLPLAVFDFERMRTRTIR